MQAKIVCLGTNVPEVTGKVIKKVRPEEGETPSPKLKGDPGKEKLPILPSVTLGDLLPEFEASPEGLISLFFLSTQAFPYPNPYANPHAMANPYARPEPNCCGAGPGCAAGLCSCCGGTTCENGACNPIIGYADGFYGPPRIQGGYGNSYNYGR